MRQKWWALSAVACGTFMATLDSSVLNIGLPAITRSLETDLEKTKWVTISYFLIITCLLLPMGKLSDLYGRKRFFILGFCLFTISSVFCAFSETLTFLIINRILQGVGAATLMTNGPAIITSSFPKNELGKALGTLAMVVSGGLISGPSIGGFLISSWGWESIFLINFPIGLLGIILAYFFILPSSPQERSHFDWLGAVLQFLFLLSFIFLFDPPKIVLSGSHPMLLSRVIPIALCILFGAMLIKIEKTQNSPVIEFSLFKNQTFWSANLASYFTFVSYMFIAVLMPFYLVDYALYSEKETGMILTSIPVIMFLTAPLSGRLSDTYGSRGICIIGAIFSSLGIFLIPISYFFFSELNTASIILSLGLLGLGLGTFQSPNNNALMSSVPEDKLGSASALLATLRNLGFVSGAGLSSSLYSFQMKNSQNPEKDFSEIFYISGTIMILSIIFSLFKVSGPVWKEKNGLET